MIDVASTVELQSRLKSYLSCDITPGQRFVVLLLGVQVVHIGCVVLAVVQLHDLAGDVRLQGSIVLRQVREGVLLPGAHGPQSWHQLLAQAAGCPAQHGETSTVLAVLG